MRVDVCKISPHKFLLGFGQPAELQRNTFISNSRVQNPVFIELWLEYKL